MRKCARAPEMYKNVFSEFLLIQGMLCDYLTAILAQKLVKIDFHEVGSFSKISKIFKKNQFFFDKNSIFDKISSDSIFVNF